MNLKITIEGSPADLNPEQRQKLRRISNVLRDDGFHVTTEFTEQPPTEEEKRWIPSVRYVSVPQ